MIASVFIGLDNRDIVDDLRRVRQQLAQPRAGLSVLLEFENRWRHRQRRLARRHARDPLPLPDRIRQILAAILGQLRLVVEQVHLRRAARLVQEDHALGLGREMRKAG